MPATNVWEIELSDGTVVEVESDHEPSEQEVLSSLGHSAESPKLPAPTHPLAAYMGGESSLTPSHAMTPAFMGESPQPAPGTREYPPDIMRSAAGAQLGKYPSDVTGEEAQRLTKQPPSSTPGWEAMYQEDQYLLPAPPVGEVPGSPFETAAMEQLIPGSSAILGKQGAVQLGRSTYNVGAGAVNFFATPTGKATLPASIVAAPLVSGYFAVDMGLSAIEQEQQLEQNWGKMSFPERVDALTALAGTGAFALGAGIHTTASIYKMAQSATPPSIMPRRPTARTQGPFTEGAFTERGPVEPEMQEVAPPPPPVELKQEQKPARAHAQAEAKKKAGFTGEYLLSEYDAAGKGTAGMMAVMEKYGFTPQEAAKAMAESRKAHGITTIIPGEEIVAALKVQRMQGTISPADLARLEALEEMTVERENIGNENAGVVDVDVQEKWDDSVPFAPPNPHSPFTIDEAAARRGVFKIIVIADKLKAMLADWRGRELSEAEIHHRMRSMMNEEVIHLFTPRELALEYYGKMSAYERWRAASIYQGRWPIGMPEAMKPAHLGWEAIRFRLQESAGVTPTEFTHMAKAQRWTWQTILAMEKVVDSIRKNSPKNTDMQRILDKVSANLQYARTNLKDKIPQGEAVEPGAPPSAAYNLYPGKPIKSYDEWRRNYDIYRNTLQMTTQNWGELYGDDFNWPREAKTNTEGLERQLENLEKEYPNYFKTYEQGGVGLPSSGPGAGPSAAYNPKGKWEQKRAEDREKLRQMREAAGLIPKTSETEKQPVEREAATESTLLSEAHEPLTPEKGEAFVKDYFRTAVETIAKDREKRKNLPKEAQARKLEPPSFEDFANKFRLKFGAVKDDALRTMFVQSAWPGINELSSQNIVELIRAMNLVQQVVGGGKPGERKLGQIAGPITEFEQMKLGLGGLKTQVEMRRALASAVGRARRAKAKESAYTGMLAEARALHQQLRDFERPTKMVDKKEVYTQNSGPIWDVDEEGGLISRSGQKITEDVPPLLRKNAIRLAELRKEMDEILYPEKQRKPEERTVITEEQEMTKQGEVTIQRARTQKGPEEYAPPAFQPGLPKKYQPATGESLRFKALAAIMNEFFKQAEGSRKPVNRKEVEPTDLGSGGKQPSFRLIRPEELKDVEQLGRILTSDALEREESATHTKRLVVLLNRSTGEVVMVDVYKHPRSKGALVLNPGISDVHQSLESILKTHTPTYSVHLSDPIRNFRRRFADMKEFMDEFGRDAENSMRIREWENFPVEPLRGEAPAETVPGEEIFESNESQTKPVYRAGEEVSGTMERPPLEGRGQIVEMERRLTDAEAGAAYDFIAGEKGTIDSVTDVGAAFESIAEVMQRPIAERPLQAISGIVKMFRSVMERNPDMSEGEVISQVARFIYENYEQRIEREWAAENIPRGVDETVAQYEQRINKWLREKLVTRTLANFRGDLPQAEPTVGQGVRAAEQRAGEQRLTEQGLAKARAATVPPENLEQTIAPGTLPPSTEARAAEQMDVTTRYAVQKAMEEAAAAAVREPRKATAPDQYDPRLTRAIRENFIKEQLDDSYFDKAVKATSKMGREINKELRRKVPKKPKETTAKWLERVREWAEKQADWEEAQNALAQNIAAGEGGPPNAALLNMAGKTLSYMVSKTVGAGIRVGSEWMVDRLRRVAPAGATETHKFLSNSNEIISQSEKYAGELFRQFGDESMELSGTFGKATTWMNDFQVILPGEGAIINAKEAIEGRIPNYPDYAVPVVTQGQKGNFLLGKFMEPVAPDFVANGGMHNNLSAFGYDVLRNGEGGSHWGQLVRSTAEANKTYLARQPRFRGLPPAHLTAAIEAEINSFFLEYKAILDDPTSSPAEFFRISQDFSKKYPLAVTHLWTGPKIGGHWEAVIHSDMYNYFNQGIRRAAMIRAFREVYPAVSQYDPVTGLKTVTGIDLNDIIKDIRREMPSEWHGLVNSLARTLQGHPSENLTQTGWLSDIQFQHSPSVTQPMGVAMRVLRPLGDTLKTGMLSAQSLLQPAEFLTGGSSIFFGYRKSAMASFLNHFTKDTQAMLEAYGAFDRLMYDNSWHPNSKIRSAFRIFNNNARRVLMQNWINEAQEMQGAGAAYIIAQRWMNANIYDVVTRQPLVRLGLEERNLNPLTWRMMGFTDSEVRLMKQGDAALLGQMVRKAPAFASGGHVHGAQQSRIMANRVFQSIWWFMRYPITRTNQFVKLWQVIAEESQAGRNAEAAKGAVLMAKFMAGTTAQGIMQTAIMTFFIGGPAALMIRLQEAEDEKAAFFFDAWRNTMGGPFQWVTRGWEDSGLHGVANNFKRLAAPFNIAGEVYDAFTGSGSYRDMGLFDRMGQFVERRMPLSKTMKLAASTIGLAEDDAELDAAMSGLNRWKRKEFDIYFRNIPQGGDDEHRAFRVQMKKAVKALNNGDKQGFNEARSQALGARRQEGVTGLKAMQSVNSSLLKRRVLVNPTTGAQLKPKEIQSLRNRIGSKAVVKLQRFDKMLEIQAGYYGPE